MSAVRILGVMTGTSCDGLDASCMEFSSPTQWKQVWADTCDYPENLKARVLKIQKPKTKVSLKELLDLDRDLGKWFGDALKKMIGNHGDAPDLIANHGQTIGHYPEASQKGHTLQIGNAAFISQITRLSVISQFRTGDMAAGGQGAPFAPAYHVALAPRLPYYSKGIIIQNIGGFSNLTYLHPDHDVFAFDTGPGNIWIDAAVKKITNNKKKFDEGGSLAALGQVDQVGLKKTLQHSFLKKSPPKSTGRDDFTDPMFFLKTKARGNDLIATATAVTVQSIAEAYEKWILKKNLPLHSIYLTGGGANNKHLIQSLQNRLPQLNFKNISEFGVAAQSMEAQAFAYLGYQTLLGHALGGPWTGAKTFGPPGQIVPGENWMNVLSKLHP